MPGWGFEPHNSDVFDNACPHQLSATVQPSEKSASSRTRTCDQLIKSQLLYQLSYGCKWALRDLNPGPTGYEPDALTTELSALSELNDGTSR